MYRHGHPNPDSHSTMRVWIVVPMSVEFHHGFPVRILKKIVLGFKEESFLKPFEKNFVANSV